MHINPALTLPCRLVSPITGAEEEFRIGVEGDKEAPAFSLETIDGWIPCPEDLSDLLRADPVFSSQVVEALTLIAQPQEEASPGF